MNPSMTARHPRTQPWQFPLDFTSTRSIAAGLWPSAGFRSVRYGCLLLASQVSTLLRKPCRMVRAREKSIELWCVITKRGKQRERLPEVRSPRCELALLK